MDAAGVPTDKKYTGGHMVVWCGVVWCSVVWCGVVWCGVELVCRNTHNGGEQGLSTQQAQNSTATGDIQHIET